MLVLIDESGCPGFKLTKGSSAYFVLCMVIFENLSQAESTSNKIATLKHSLNINSEFKFSKTHPTIKDKFFDTICQFDFKVQALVIDKCNIYSSRLRNDTDSFYNHFVKMLLQYDRNVLQNASIKLDGNGDKEFKRALTIYLRRYVDDDKIKKFKFVDSKKDHLIQLADMIVGAIARYYNPNRKDAGRWFNVLKRTRKLKKIWYYK